MGGILAALGLVGSVAAPIADSMAVLDGLVKARNWLSSGQANERGVAEAARLHRYPVGRDKDLKKIFDALEAPGRVAVLKGMGGVGKTTLARMYVAAHGKRYAEIAWLNAEMIERLAEGIAAKGPRIKGFTLPPGTPLTQAKAVLEALPKNWLLVYDNAPDLATIRDLMPPIGRANVLVTSRDRKWAGYAQVEPEVLGTETIWSDGVRLLIQESMSAEDWAQTPHLDGPEARLNELVGMVARADRAQEVVSLARTLGGLPLGLVIAGALIREEGGTFALWETRIGEIMAEAEGTDYDRSISAAVRLSYDRLGADARAVVDLFAWYAAEGLDAALLTDVPGSERSAEYLEPISADLRKLCGDPGRVAAALRELVRRSVLTQDGEAYSLHRLTATALRGFQGERREAAMGAATVLAAGYPYDSDISENWPACARLTPHVLAFRRAARDTAPALAAVSYLYNQAAIYLGKMALTEDSLDLAEESLRLTRARLPEWHRDVAVGYSLLCNRYSAAERHDAAVTAGRESVRLRETHSHSAADLATGLNNLASALRARGQATGDRADLEAARDLELRALAIRETEFGAESEEVAETLNNLAGTHDALGDRAAAIDAAERTLAILTTLLPAGDARLGFAKTNLGGYLLLDGRAAAAGHLAAALTILRGCLPAGHPHLAIAARWLATARLKLGDRAGAEALVQQFGLDRAWIEAFADSLPPPR